MANASDNVSNGMQTYASTFIDGAAQNFDNGSELNQVQQEGQDANNFLAGMYAITEKLDEQRAVMQAAHKQVTEAYSAAGQA